VSLPQEVVKANPQKYTAVTLGSPNNVYQSIVRNPAMWGGAIDIDILADHFQTGAVLVCNEDDSTCTHNRLLCLPMSAEFVAIDTQTLAEVIFGRKLGDDLPLALIH